jgi:hypothetical protein
MYSTQPKIIPYVYVAILDVLMCRVETRLMSVAADFSVGSRLSAFHPPVVQTSGLKFELLQACSLLKLA